MERKHLILLSFCCLWIYVANARVISSVKSTKVRTIKIPACGCNRPLLDVSPCGCRGLALDLPYTYPCDLDIRRPCGCQKPIYVDPIEIPLCGCGSGLPLATVFSVEMPCGCQSPQACACGYKASAIQLPSGYELVEIPQCGCQGTVKPCGCQPIGACGCQNPVSTCGCQSLNPCGCQGAVLMNYDCIPSYNVAPCKCNSPVTEISCGCQGLNCGCCGVQLSSPYDCLASIMESCGCVIPSISEVPIYTTGCGCQSTLCECQSTPCECQSTPCGCQSTPCGCQSTLCGCQSSPCACQNTVCGCKSTPCVCQTTACGCGGGCACGCSGVTLPPMAPVVGCTKYLRQVTLLPPFL